MKTYNLQKKEIVEPYAGSAIVSLSLVANEVVSKATLIERAPSLIYSFWKAVFNHTDALVSKIEGVSVNIDSWHYFRELLKHDQPDEDRVVELALACIFLNRTNFSGVLHSGPIGGRSQSSQYKIDCRFIKKDIVSRIKNIAQLKERIFITFGDALSFLNKFNAKNTKECFYYIDPPYFKQGSQLYRFHYKTVDHKRLADVLNEADFPWLLSYDKDEFIELLYANFQQIHQSFRYMSKIPKTEKELVITNMKNSVQKNTKPSISVCRDSGNKIDQRVQRVP
ncbi:DNA adenine methylase [Methylomonas sp. EbB]|uniref:site-specific DNA-methyltransferase (adenine-specific) n=1 Tax=Methylomonas fluvii TaxID=1854564 RepID=A0ABR9D9L3_9GAMM|nr:DNA adenine methylase [Methylomonas fluvii]